MFEVWMVNTWEGLIVLLIFTALMQQSPQRFIANLFYVLAIILHHIMFRDNEGLAYYGTDALFCLGVIMLTSGMNPITKTTLRIQLLCLAGVLLNFVGWLMWFFYLSPMVYNLLFLVVYALAAYTFIKRDGLNVGGFTELYGWRSCVRFDLHPMFKYILKIKDKA